MNLILLGVAGSGKTTIGQRLAARLGGRWRFYDADDFHPPGNIAKMSRGTPLDDTDRAPWLAALRTHLDTCAAREESAILACSAIKEAYRRRLAGSGEDDTRFVYLRGDFALIHERMRSRPGHYFKESLLPSQFAALEEPVPGTMLVVDVAALPDEIVERIVTALGLDA
ncbi:MAG: gluconokinase [Opitutaceae bacterium]|nr:gluconokinase [Opitutaceae bacterium]